MAERRDILFRLLGDSKSLQRASRAGESSLSTLGRAAKQAAGFLGVGLGIEGARRIGQQVWELVKLGDAVKAVARSFDEVFGPAARMLREEMDTTRKRMGLARSEFESMVLPIGQMATNAGLSATNAADLGAKLVTLAGDVAAFNPLVGSSTEALGAMQAALRGEFDPLERFGSKLSAARVQAEAARLRGVDPLNASLSDQELQIMAVVSLLEQDFAPAMGTLEERAGDATIMANEGTASWKDFREELGKFASDAAPKAAGELAHLVQEQREAIEGGNVFGQTLDNIGSVLGALLSPADALFDAWRRITEQPAKFKEFADTSQIIADAMVAAAGGAADLNNELRNTPQVTVEIVPTLGDLEAFASNLYRNPGESLEDFLARIRRNNPPSKGPAFPTAD